ncbi:MAG: c-type cytochrome [Bacteroidetes bacterium]|nr:c-type cytochrome [Bacteroidota bacterium]
MKSRSGFIYIVIIFFAILNLSSKKLFQDNHPPSVKIIVPVNNMVFKPGTSVNYRLSVTDKEDGSSEFDEINNKEVLLEVRYIKDKSKIPGAGSNVVEADAPGLAVIRTSNCLNCHNFSSKSIGPSFFEISKRYPNTKANADTLIKNIKNGSTGTWGKEKMPSHPELTPAEIKNTVEWILKNGSAKDINYYNGINGMISLAPNRNGIYVLTASYTDHGMKDVVGKRLKGAERVLITVR